MAACEEFRRSERRRDFLIFICKKTLQEPPEDVHEQSMDDYVRRRAVNRVNTREQRQIAGGQYTSVADIMILHGLLQATAPFQTPTRVGYARDISIEEFRSNNFMLVGSVGSNPWDELLEPLRNFRDRRDVDSDVSRYVNNQPLPGESARYCNQVGPAASCKLIASFLLCRTSAVGERLDPRRNLRGRNPGGGNSLPVRTLIPNCVSA